MKRKTDRSFRKRHLLIAPVHQYATPPGSGARTPSVLPIWDPVGVRRFGKKASSTPSTFRIPEQGPPEQPRIGNDNFKAKHLPYTHTAGPQRGPILVTGQLQTQTTPVYPNRRTPTGSHIGNATTSKPNTIRIPKPQDPGGVPYWWQVPMVIPPLSSPISPLQNPSKMYPQNRFSAGSLFSQTTSFGLKDEVVPQTWIPPCEIIFHTTSFAFFTIILKGPESLIWCDFQEF